MNGTEQGDTGVENDHRRLNLGDGLRIAVETIVANRARSLLTMFGVSVGVTAVMLLTAFVTGLRISIQDSVEASGPRNFVITRFDFTAARVEDDSEEPWWTRPEIRPVEADRIGRLASVGEALYNVRLNVTVDFDGRRLADVQGQGYAAGWPSYTQGNFIAGRDFTPSEVRRSRAIAVVSDELARELFGGRDPIGRRIGLVTSRSGRSEFSVVGVFAPGAQHLHHSDPALGRRAVHGRDEAPGGRRGSSANPGRSRRLREPGPGEGRGDHYAPRNARAQTERGQ